MFDTIEGAEESKGSVRETQLTVSIQTDSRIIKEPNLSQQSEWEIFRVLTKEI